MKAALRIWSRNRRRPTAAITVVELLVATAGLLVVMFIVLRIYEQTATAAKKMTSRQTAIDYGIGVIDEIGRLLYDAIAPGDLDLQDPSAAGALFQSDRITIASFPRGASAGLYLITVAPAEDPSEGTYYEQGEKPVSEATGTEPVEGGGGGGGITRPFPLGVKALDFKPTISFRYALEAPQPGASINYSESLEEGQWPALVEVSVFIEREDDPLRPIELRTAIIPGRRQSGPASASSSTETPASAPSGGR